jgi:hypothetical protein
MVRSLVARVLVILFAAAVLSGASHAATLNCSSISRLSELLPGGDSSDGCVRLDKLWSNFTYSITTGSFAPSAIMVNFLSVPNDVGQDVHQVTFLGGWNVPFTLSYTISVVGSPKTIIAAQNQGWYPFQTDNGEDLATTAGGVTVHATVGVPSPGIGTLPSPLTSVTVSHSYSPGTPAGSLFLFSEAFTQADPIPEPATYVLLRSSLMSLGWLGRRLRHR